MITLSLDQLTTKIASWGYARSITINGRADTQTLKLGSEFGELCDAIAKDRSKEIADSLGDMFVVMVMIAELKQLDITECVQAAWEEIKDRKGYLNSSGVFIKEGDVEKT